MSKLTTIAVIALTTSLAAMQPSVAHDRTAIERRNVETVTRLLLDGWGAREGWQSVWRETMVSDVQSFFHAQPPSESIDDAIAFNAGLFEGFPSLDLEIVGIVAEGDEVIVRGRLRGTQDGPFLGVPATGNAVDVPDVTMFTLADGRVTEMRYFTDLLAVMSAIGAIPNE